MVLLLISSGVRIGELAKLELDDVNMESTPPGAFVRHPKNGKPRHVYFSQEARQALAEWLKVRDAYYETSRRRALGSGKKRYTAGQRLFPFHVSLLQRQFMTDL